MNTDNPTMDLLESAFNLLCHNPPTHYDCMSDQCDGCDWDALQLQIANHIRPWNVLPLVDRRDFTIKYHDSTCTMSHLDRCSWQYEMERGHNWEASSHVSFLKCAELAYDSGMRFSGLSQPNSSISGKPESPQSDGVLPNTKENK